MRFGAPIPGDYKNPDDWVSRLQTAGYSAAYCPVSSDDDSATIKAYADAAAAANIVIAEVGAWSNPISPDDDIRKAAIEKCEKQLALADEIDARCCVNIAGSRSEQWDGPHAENFTQDTFDLIVETVRGIIDAVKPTRSYYTLETMWWMFPYTTETYQELIQAIDRPRFAVHFDPVNLITSPETYYKNAQVIRHFVSELGSLIKSIHCKDMLLHPKYGVHIDEVRPGLGDLNYSVLLRELNKLDADTPLMLEHLPQEEYAPAAEYVRGVMKEINLSFV